MRLGVPIPMNENLSSALRKILIDEADGRLVPRDEDPDGVFVYSFINYARAKRQASEILRP